MAGISHTCQWIVAVALVATMGAGCVAPADNAMGETAACPADTEPTAEGTQMVHLRIWTDEMETVCVNTSFNQALVASGVVNSPHPEPGMAREEPFVPRSFGEHSVPDMSILVEVSAPAWDVAYDESVPLRSGDTWIVIEVGKAGAEILTYDEDPYGNPD